MNKRTPAGLLVGNVRYPPSEDYFFEPIKEHVPVYQRPFRIVQDVTIDPSAQGEAALKDASNLRIGGNLSYQACNDTICFTPQVTPLMWTVRLRPLDLERAKGRD